MELNKNNVKKMLLIITFTLVLLVLLQNIQGVIRVVFYVVALLFPFILGGAIAFVFHVPMNFLEKKLFTGRRKNFKGKRAVSLLLTLIFILSIFFIVLFLIIPELQRTIASLVIQIPKAIERFQAWLTELAIPWPEIEKQIAGMEIKWEEVGKEIISFLQNSAGGIFNSTFGVVSSIVSGVANFFIAFVFAVYVLFQKEKLGRQMRLLMYSFLPQAAADKTLYICRLSNQIFSSFLTGQCTEAVILGTMFFITMSIFKFPYALLVGVVIAVTALIPILGSFIGCILGVILLVFVNPLQAFWFIILFLILQQIEGNLIYPHVVGGSVGLPSMWVLLAVTIGGSTMGVVGMLINIPLFSILYTLLREYVYKRIRIRKVPESKWKS